MRPINGIIYSPYLFTDYTPYDEMSERVIGNVEMVNGKDAVTFKLECHRDTLLTRGSCKHGKH